MRYALLAGTILATAAPAFADQSAQNASAASKQASIAVGAIGESGLRATSGVVAIPLGGVALASGAVGVAAGASGQFELANGFSEASAAAVKDARSLVEFSNAPLSITDDVVVAKPQPAPKVPFTPAAQ
jgi:hypothetical protein